MRSKSHTEKRNMKLFYCYSSYYNQNEVFDDEHDADHNDTSPRFLCLPTAFFFDLLEPWDVRELYIRKTADLPLQLCVDTFPRFVAIGFYFLSETLI